MPEKLFEGTLLLWLTQTIDTEIITFPHEYIKNIQSVIFIHFCYLAGI